jgi:hypothetical protein
MRTYILRHGKNVVVRNRFGGEHRKIVHLWAGFDGATIRSVSDPIADRRYDRWFGNVRRERKLNHVVQREDQQELSDAITNPRGIDCECDFDLAPAVLPEAHLCDAPRDIYHAPGLELDDNGSALTYASFGGDDELEEPRVRPSSSRAYRRTPRNNYMFGARVLACN